MHDPTDDRFKKIQALHRNGEMVGLNRPVSRCTWARQSLQQLLSTKDGVGPVRYLAKNPEEFEFVGVTDIEIQRSIGQDAATCTIQMFNVSETTLDPDGIDTAGTKGYLSPGRGDPYPQMTSVYTGLAVDGYTAPLPSPIPIVVPDGGTRFDLPFYQFPTSWGYANNSYRDVFVPNRVIRTYQGYGSDNFDQLGNEIFMHDPSSAGYVAPREDQQLYLTGTWLIDVVTLNADGTMTLECRDLAKLLIEQYIYPPLLPLSRFPLYYCPAHKSQGHKESIGKNVAVYSSSSADARYGHNGSVLGHRGSHAFDGKPATFWLSGPNSIPQGLEWLQAATHGPINEIVLNCYGGNYIAYVSVHENGRWQGTTPLVGNSENLSEGQSPGDGPGYLYVITSGDTLWDLAGRYYGDNFLWPIIAKANSNIIKDPHWIYPGQRIKVPYVRGTNLPPPSGFNGTGGTRVDIPIVARATVPSNGKATIRLPRTYNADHVRVIFTNLNRIGDGSPYRAGVREMVVRNHISNTYVPGNVGKATFIQDWTEPIKEMCAWAGFTWEDPAVADPVIGKQANGSPLRIWGDFELLGAGPIVCTPGDYFMSKSFMDGIRQIVDFIGGIFFVDETGGVQFRLPNIWTGGNFIDDPLAPRSLSARLPWHPIEFHEDVNLMSYQAVISDASVRSEILVIGGYPNQNSGAVPVAGGYVLGYNSETHTTSAIDFTNILGGQYRIMIVPGDSTKLFYTEAECQRMAELTALFILFTYRQGTATIAGHPGLQIDDQVRIFERTTYEHNVHYVSAIDSKHDLRSGEYTMDVTTHWLGADPDTDWFVDKAQLTPAVKQLPAILKRIGMQPGGDTFEQPPYGT